MALTAHFLNVGRGVRQAGHLVLLGGGIGYAAVAVWHFIEHANGRDPDLPHILLLVTNAAMFVGAGWLGLAAWRRRRKDA